MAGNDKRKREEEEEEPRVRVVDKRRLLDDDSKTKDEETSPDVKAGEPSADTVTVEPPSGPDPGDGQRAEEFESDEELRDKDAMLLPVRDLMRIFLAELQLRAWIHMGIVANPTNNLVTKDLAEARLAIDMVAVLVEKLSPMATSEEREEFNRMLTDLRLNFVQQSV